MVVILWIIVQILENLLCVQHLDQRIVDPDVDLNLDTLAHKMLVLECCKVQEWSQSILHWSLLDRLVCIHGSKMVQVESNGCPYCCLRNLALRIQNDLKENLEIIILWENPGNWWDLEVQRIQLEYVQNYVKQNDEEDCNFQACCLDESCLSTTIPDATLVMLNLM